MGRPPDRLERPPLVEAILELRFGAAQGSVGDLLPGLLYGKLRHLFERVEPLPFAGIPRELRESNPDLRYRPHLRLVGPDQALLIGDHVVAFSRNPPYSGWANLRQVCQETLAAIQSTNLIGSVERFAFKTVNIIELAGNDPRSVVNGELRLGSHHLIDRGLRVRAEIDRDGYVNIIEIAGGATAQFGKTSKNGLMLSVDCLRTTTSEQFWTSVPEILDSAHATLKQIFFELLTPAYVSQLGPSWDGDA